MITYNHEPYIAEAIEGVLMQKCSFPIELVIGEDCSTDNTRKICEEYANKSELIKLLPTETNLGMMPNFIRTLQSCTGKYIAMCEGDDYWTDPLKLQKQVDFLEANAEYVLTFHNRLIIGFNGQIQKGSIGESEKKVPSDRMISTFMPTLTMLFRNNIDEMHKEEYNSVFSGDVLVRAILSTKGPSYFLPFYGAVYRQHDGGVYSSKGIENRLKLGLDTRNCILKNAKGINKSDLHFSKFNITNELLEYYLMDNKALEGFKILPKLLFYMIASRRFVSFKMLLISLRNGFKIFLK